jgi:hypothetical protein
MTQLEEIGTADIAFEATGARLVRLFRDAAEATANAMIDNIEAIQPRETRQIELSNDKLDILLFDLLQELIFLKDAERSRWESRPYAPVATERWSSPQIESRRSRVSVRRVNRAYNRGLRFAQRSGYSVMGEALESGEAAASDYIFLRTAVSVLALPSASV